MKNKLVTKDAIAIIKSKKFFSAEGIPKQFKSSNYWVIWAVTKRGEPAPQAPHA